MGIGKKLAGRFELLLARALAARPATPLILAGTMTMAAFGAAATNPTTVHSLQSPVAHRAMLDLSNPHTFCGPDPDGDGNYVCHILASQVTLIPNLGCYSDPDGDGTAICYYATDPTAAN